VLVPTTLEPEGFSDLDPGRTFYVLGAIGGDEYERPRFRRRNVLAERSPTLV
jgi:hypothetical protein